MPDWRAEIRKRLAGLRLAPTREAEIVEELAQHLELLYEERLANGATEREASEAQMRELQESKLLQQELQWLERYAPPEPVICKTRRGYMLGDLLQDMRYGVRMLKNNPSFTLIAVITLSLGIGANTAIFSVVNAVLLQPLPYKNAAELLIISRTPGDEDNWPFSPGAYQDLRRNSTGFTELAALSNKGWPANLTEWGEPTRLQGFQVSANLFALLGVAAEQGRTFYEEEDRPGANRVVVLSHELWRQRFGAEPQIIGQAITLNNQAYTVIGVMPADFRFYTKTDLWKPL